MGKTAILVDGHFLFKKISEYGSFYVNGKYIRDYCLKHVNSFEELYRIFYYDSEPNPNINAIDPFGNQFSFNTTQSYQKHSQMINDIKNTPNIALRLGKSVFREEWLLRNDKLKDLINGKIDIKSITISDFNPKLQQKAVDMKIGIDIATLALKKLVDKVVLIAGDADFAPAAKLARIEGLLVVLDSLGQKVSDELCEHVDIIDTKLTKNDIKKNKPKFNSSLAKKI